MLPNLPTTTGNIMYDRLSSSSSSSCSRSCGSSSKQQQCDTARVTAAHAIRMLNDVRAFSFSSSCWQHSLPCRTVHKPSRQSLDVPLSVSSAKCQQQSTGQPPTCPAGPQEERLPLRVAWCGQRLALNGEAGSQPPEQRPQWAHGGQLCADDALVGWPRAQRLATLWGLHDSDGEALRWACNKHKQQHVDWHVPTLRYGTCSGCRRCYSILVNC